MKDFSAMVSFELKSDWKGAFESLGTKEKEVASNEKVYRLTSQGR